MKKIIRIFSMILLVSLFLPCITPMVQAKGKGRRLTDKDEFCVKVTENEWYDYDDSHTSGVYRNDYGLIAKDVKKVWVKEMDHSHGLYISQKGNVVNKIDLTHWKAKGNVRYKMISVTKDAVEMYQPYGYEVIWKDSKGEYFDTYLSHKSVGGKKVEYVKTEKMPKMKGVKKCWDGYGMFAYIKNNALKITGLILETMKGSKKNGELTFFKGKGNQIKEVITSGGGEPYNANCILVLMKDGSVWGLGENKYKMLGEEDSTEKFVEIISEDAVHIQACADRVAMLKKDHTLWLWGRTMDKRYDGECSAEPVKIASKVKEFSIGGVMDGCHMLILKTNHTAYGMGGQGYAKVFTYRNPKTWYAKPVKLMEHVKHVYTEGGAGKSVFLTQKNELYWTGRVYYNPMEDLWSRVEPWSLPGVYYKSDDLMGKKTSPFWQKIGVG